MGFPWSAWFETTQTGDIMPLLLAVAGQFFYYMFGIYRMTRGNRGTDE